MKQSYDIRHTTGSSKKVVVFTGFVCVVVVMGTLIRLGNVADRRYIDKCIAEKKLHFQGVIRNYQTSIPDEKSYFHLGSDSASIVIPRNWKEMPLNDDDTILKSVGGNTYIVKRAALWNWQEKKSIDTFRFDCP